MNRLPLHALSGFAAAARSSNLTRAAAAQHLTVSALSHQIRGLEERLGRRLFDRGPRGVRLTADGERLLARIGPHLDALAEAVRPATARRDDVLTISVLPSLASGWLVPRLGGFLAAHPQLQLSLLSSERLVDFDRDPGVDAALRMGPGRWPGVTAEHLLDESLAPVASPALLARHGMPTAATLHQWPLLGESDATHWEVWFARHGGHAPARYVASFDDLESLHRAAVAGMGVALARMVRSRSLVEAGQLVVLSEQRLPSDFAHYLVYPPRSADHRGLLAFRDWLHAQARDDAATG
ncbi:LysR substrate-binding domain-containing protein [Cognatiluteimonas weifangensis]|uniref:LysR family transcriptional regulator n=1 Tax=Cognatiluteimonas weifangensis TaxID=2303539 RepID=A0A372DPD8_9GAMM|nr:LysR substrate-binding domain-containing protein [Luteimonas weifangensis]RFP61413.1 LysR family transcriptional regulator [Luteimonas weifangensis]